MKKILLIFFWAAVALYLYFGDRFNQTLHLVSGAVLSVIGTVIVVWYFVKKLFKRRESYGK